jgi:GNAT superfamily N-acetyltransferase
MTFPHLYGPLPVAAATSVVPYRPGPDGYAPPAGLPAHDDLLGRAVSFDRSLAERRAAALLPVSGGFAALDPRVPASWEHNSLWIRGDVPADDVRADALRVLGPARTHRIVFDRPPPEGLGWEVEVERLMVLGPDVEVPAPPPGIDVVAVTSEVMHGLWGPTWRRDIPGIGDDAVADLLRRESFADAHVRIVDLAVLGDGGVPVAATQLRIDGATAAVEAVMTDEAVRGRGYATATVLDAVRRARAAGCDLVWLIARAEDWPRHWYARLGFDDVGARWIATKHPT